MATNTAKRVSENTDPEINDQIRLMTEARVAFYREHPNQIGERLDALDREWDIERVLQATAGALGSTGTFLGLLGRRRWLLLSGIVSGFLFQHAMQGWCPPIPLFRRMGFRTAREIEWERSRLTALREEKPGKAEVTNGGGKRSRSKVAQK